MRVSFNNGKVDVVVEDEQAWEVWTEHKHLLWFPKSNGTPIESNGRFNRGIDHDLILSDDTKKDITIRCPIHELIVYFVPHESRMCYVYDPVFDKWILAFYDHSTMKQAFESVFIHLEQKAKEYDRECENAKHLKIIANVLENFKSMNDLLTFATSVIEIAKK